MKAFTTGLLKGRITRRRLLAAVLPAAGGVSLAWTGHHHYRLGGGWVGSGAGSEFSVLYIPLDPAGQKAALRVNTITYGADTAGLVAAFGADAITD